MKSIRVFLVVATLAMLVLVVFISAVQGFQSSMAEAMSLFDEQLRVQARFAAHLSDTEFLTTDNELTSAYQIWRYEPEGPSRLLAHTGNMPGNAVTGFEPGFGYANFSGYRWRTYVYADPSAGRLAVAAARMDVRYQLAEDIITQAILPVVLLLPISGLLIWLIIGRGLKPLEALSVQLAKKESRDLSPVRLQIQPKELNQVIDSVNSLLFRLQSAFEREKRFSSDAAHELRTPISALKVQIYNLEQKYPDHSAELRELRSGAERMQHLIEQMLDLHKVAPEQILAKFTRIDLLAVVQDVIAENFADFENKEQEIECDGNESALNGGAVIEGDLFALATLIGNLLSNANKYTPRGGRIRVYVSAAPSLVTLVVEDTGRGIPAEERDRIFERFHRVAGDRHASGQPGCGLGLAIVKSIVELHGGTITVEDSSLGQGSCFKISFRKEGNQ